MIDFNKYNEKEVFAAIRVVEEILDVEDFNLDVRKGTAADGWRMSDDSLVGEDVFCFIDRQGAYLGDIDADVFFNLGGVIDRTDTYHNDSFYNDYEERRFAGEEIPQDDWDRKVLIFLESGYCQELLMAIDVETYLAYKDKALDELNLNPGEKERYAKDGKFDCVGYLCDKSIATAILDTQSAYHMLEYDNRIFVEAHADWYENEEAMLTDLKAGEESFCDSYYSYAVVIETEQWQVKDDMYDIGLYDDKDNWGFYLSEYELEYIGLRDELEKMKYQYETEDMLVHLDEGNEKLVDELIADVVERSNATGVPGKNDVGFEK